MVVKQLQAKQQGFFIKNVDAQIDFSFSAITSSLKRAIGVTSTIVLESYLQNPDLRKY